MWGKKDIIFNFFFKGENETKGKKINKKKKFK
jgi:hypothetical protein